MRGLYNIIKPNIRVEENVETRGNEIGNLTENSPQILKIAMVEFIDAVLPLAFVIAFSTAFYGPNAGLVRNIGNNYFGGRAITDPRTNYLVMLQMFAIDIFSMTVSGLSLYYFLRINLFQAFCNMMKKYWMIFVVTIPRIMMAFGTKDVNFGMDFSGKYEWITDEGRANLIRNAIEISEEEKLALLSNSTLM